jgi:hypothetical protein
MDEEKVLRTVYGCALMVCSFQWHLFMAREDRGKGHVESAAAHVREAQELSDEILRLYRFYGGRVREE